MLNNNMNNNRIRKQAEKLILIRFLDDETFKKLNFPITQRKDIILNLLNDLSELFVFVYISMTV